MSYTVRDYTPADEPWWLRCRVLSFLSTAYFDDVDRAKPAIEPPGLELIAVDDHGTVVGITDTIIEGELATIDTGAVHPDLQHRGLGRRLLEQTRERARAAGAVTLNAWTRDDPDTLAWYRAMGFTESDHYLHVHANYRADPHEPGRTIIEPRPDLRPVMAFLHASLADEEQLRDQFARVHVCRRFAMPI
ncbi:GNAT family N-acetyltransferase [Streptomyces sp. NPDC005877]|uniref:GNAT family N-acetyltransferase n=1 Tax=Streptomyces sp. NPDC005877 TaxID=3155346 RepID=UPI0033E88054